MPNKLRYPRGHWKSVENCREVAANYKGTRSEFIKEYPKAYLNLTQWGMFDELIPSKKKERTYERFMEIARGCSTKGEVEAIDASLCSKAAKEGWFKDCPWIPEHNYKPWKWTDEERWKAALQCETRGEYCERFNGAYWYDVRHGLLDRYTHFIHPIAEGRDPNAEDYDIYVYPDYENKVAYIGLTYFDRREQRDKEHRYGRKDKDGTIIYDAAAKYWQSMGKEMPKPKYVMEGLHINDVGYFEGWYIDAYKKAGWKVLNIAPAGSLGGAKVKWNSYEAVAEKSKEYETRSQFCHGCGQAAKKAYHTYTEDGILWIDTFYWLKDSHEARSEASRKRQTGKKQTEEHRKHISIALRKYHEQRKSVLTIS